MAKRWFQSKTIWWNVTMFIIATLLDKPLVFPVTTTLLLATSFVNMYLRFKTKEACTI